MQLESINLQINVKIVLKIIITSGSPVAKRVKWLILVYQAMSS